MAMMVVAWAAVAIVMESSHGHDGFGGLDMVRVAMVMVAKAAVLLVAVTDAWWEAVSVARVAAGVAVAMVVVMGVPWWTAALMWWSRPRMGWSASHLASGFAGRGASA